MHKNTEGQAQRLGLPWPGATEGIIFFPSLGNFLQQIFTAKKIKIFPKKGVDNFSKICYTIIVQRERE